MTYGMLIPSAAGEAMVLIAVTCPYCQSDQVRKRGKIDTGKQRYRCQNLD